MEDWRKDIGKHLRLEGSIKLDEPVAPYTTFRIGGPADVLLEPESLEDLQMIAEFLAKRRELPWQILGGGSNVLYPERYPGLIIHPGKGLSEIERKDETVVAGGGAKLDEVILEAAKWGLCGMEFLAGIPGSMGGALKGNAGAFGRQISEVVEEVRGFDLKEGETVTFKKDDIRWSYRSTDLSPTLFVYQVVLKLNQTGISKCMNKISQITAQRWAKHPAEPSAGCVFVNPDPPEVTAGKLIDELGFKGKRVGDALCSPRHANFIVNMGNATQDEVLELVSRIKEAVRERFGYQLREEIKIITLPKKVENNNGGQ